MNLTDFLDAEEDTSIEFETADPEELAVQLEVLAEENRRLREEYTRARQTTYRRTAIGLFMVGAFAGLGAILFPALRTVLIAISATGAFSAILTYYLTPERFITASVGESIYQALATVYTTLISELGLQDRYLYLPLNTDITDEQNAALFVPQHADFTLPDRNALDSLFVVTDTERSRGIALQPTGDPLARQFNHALSGPLADTPHGLADQLTDAIVEQFELADSATSDIDSETDRITIAITENAYGSLTRPDHPIASFVTVGLAVGLNTPVELQTTRQATNDRADYLIICDFYSF